MKTIILLIVLIISLFFTNVNAYACSAHIDKNNCDESQNAAGPNRCTVNDDCAGTRTCSGAGFCQN